MGEVYRATDTRLERVVAIKVLVVLYEMATGAQPFRGETYEDFLTLWKDADPGVPILRQAKAEYARLPGQAP